MNVKHKNLKNAFKKNAPQSPLDDMDSKQVIYCHENSMITEDRQMIQDGYRSNCPVSLKTQNLNVK